MKCWYLVHLIWISYGIIYTSSPRYNTLVITDALSPLTLSPSSFCLSGSTPVKVLMDCFRSITVSSSDRELMEYSWPPHFMITDTDMALHTHTRTRLQLELGTHAHRRVHTLSSKYFQQQGQTCTRTPCKESGTGRVKGEVSGCHIGTGCSLSKTWKVANNEAQREKHGITIVKHDLFWLANSRHNGQMPPNQSRHWESLMLIFLAWDG